MKRFWTLAAAAFFFLLAGCVTLNITVYFQPEQLDKAAEKSVERMWNLDGSPAASDSGGAAPESATPEPAKTAEPANK
jgi:hypothetical protein